MQSDRIAQSPRDVIGRHLHGRRRRGALRSATAVLRRSYALNCQVNRRRVNTRAIRYGMNSSLAFKSQANAASRSAARSMSSRLIISTGAVHVAVRDADEARRDAAAGGLHGVGVGAGGRVRRRPADTESPPCPRLGSAARRRPGSCSGSDKSRGPPPSLMSPSCFLSIVGQSVACVTSTAMPTCGSTV